MMADLRRSRTYSTDVWLLLQTAEVPKYYRMLQCRACSPHEAQMPQVSDPLMIDTAHSERFTNFFLTANQQLLHDVRKIT